VYDYQRIPRARRGHHGVDAVAQSSSVEHTALVFLGEYRAPELDDDDVRGHGARREIFRRHSVTFRNDTVAALSTRGVAADARARRSRAHTREHIDVDAVTRERGERDGRFGARRGHRREPGRCPTRARARAIRVLHRGHPERALGERRREQTSEFVVLGAWAERQGDRGVRE